MLSWTVALHEFHTYLHLERSFSEHTVAAYLRDAKAIHHFTSIHYPLITPADLTETHIQHYLAHLLDMGISPYTQARMLSGARVFYEFLLMNNYITKNPFALIESPKLPKKLPDVLTVEEIDRMIVANDLTTSEGIRNKAILEMLYATGMRVSELVQLRLQDIDMDLCFVNIFGKGKKERLTPMSDSAVESLKVYLASVRNHQMAKKDSQHIVFLNRRGEKLSRVMIFLIIKKLAQKANIIKNVSPHTFRHSFATHLIENGADLRAVQEMLGHESITTTEIYTHLDMKHLRNVVLQYHPRVRWKTQQTSMSL
ncbi:MAG: site-specific tyrosine recombinase XerD [Flammeovirgaceae bacterium]|nr:site-specific tyrosine recombinase XerD [Flammeovirgaceae bacterium]